MERWIDIDGFEGAYAISDNGKVKSLPRKWSPEESILKPQISKFGYLKVQLGKGIGTFKDYKIHRLVATYFVPNPHNYEEVNYKDGNKLNNHYSNLEWCTRSHNIKHAFDNKLANISSAQRETMSNNAKVRVGSKSTNGKKVINIKTGEVYPTMKIAADSINMKVVTLRAMLENRNPNRTNLRIL